MMDHGSVRNLEQIQESDGERTPRAATILLVALGGACIVFAGLALGGKRSATQTAKVDPLDVLLPRSPGRDGDHRAPGNGDGRRRQRRRGAVGRAAPAIGEDGAVEDDATPTPGTDPGRGAPTSG